MNANGKSSCGGYWFDSNMRQWMTLVMAQKTEAESLPSTQRNCPGMGDEVQLRGRVRPQVKPGNEGKNEQQDWHVRRYAFALPWAFLLPALRRHRNCLMAATIAPASAAKKRTWGK